MSLRAKLGLKEDETLHAIIHRAPITVAPAAFGVLILFAAAFFFMTLFVRWETLGTILFWSLLGLGLLLGARLLVTWRLSFLAVTDRRLIFVRQKGFFDRTVTNLPFPKIHEISHQVKGVFATVCGFGSLLIESAGSDEPIVMACVARPSEVHEMIGELQTGGHGGFADILQNVSRMRRRDLEMLRAEIERTLRDSVEDGEDES